MSRHKLFILNDEIWKSVFKPNKNPKQLYFYISEINHEPTLDELDKLALGFGYDWNDKLYVRASKIDDIHIEYSCPICALAGNKRSVHRHGSGSDQSNRIEGGRETHCLTKVYRDGKEVFDKVIIGVTDRTRRRRIR